VRIRVAIAGGPMTPPSFIMRPATTALAIVCAAAMATATLSSDAGAQLSSKPLATKSDRPIPDGDDKFICCRAMVYDCRVKAIWALRDIRGNTDDQLCVASCLSNLRC
jgi:hypothetical protein